MDQKQIVSKSAIYLLGNLSSKLMSAILIPIYAYFVSSEDLGTFDYAQSIMNVLVPILFVAFWEGVLKFILVSPESEGPKVINTAASFVMILGILYTIIAVIGVFVVSDKLTWIFIWGMIISHGIAQVWQYFCRAVKQTKQYLYASIIGAAVNLITTILFTCIFDLDLMGLYVAYILGQLSVFIVIEKKLRMTLRIKCLAFDNKLLKKMLLFSFPLMFNTLGLWLIPMLMRTVVICNIGNEANGLYAFANKFNIVVTLLGTVVSMALVEEAIISSKSSELSPEYGKSVSRIFVMFEQLTAIAILALSVLYVFLETTEYYVTVEYFSWFLVYSLLMNLGSYIGTVFQVINITKYQFISTIVGGLAGVIIAYVLSSRIGMWGIIVGQILAGFLIMLIRYILANNKSSFRLEWKNIIWNGSIVVCVAAEITLNRNISVNLILLAFVVVLVGFLNRELVSKGVAFIKKRNKQ